MGNEEQAKFWTEEAGPVWLEREGDLDVVSQPFGVAAMDAADIRPGAKILDVGCGTGGTTIELARRAAPGGEVLGLDISPLLLDRAREKVRDAEVAGVDFVAGDAQTHDLPADHYDCVFSRFGVMFFEDPVAAFSNLRAGTAKGGRLAFACWQDVFKNLWMSLPTMAASSVLGGFDLPPEGAPGPFAFADPEHVRSIIARAGWSDVDLDSFESTMDADVSQAPTMLTFILQMGPLGDAFLTGDAETQERTMTAVLEAAEPHRSDGVYRLPAAAWIVTATN